MRANQPPSVPAGTPSTSASFEDNSAVLKIGALTVHYGALPAVHNISFEVSAGQIVGLVGPNGAGKTTLVETVGGLRRTRVTGSISVCGVDPRRGHREVRRLVGMQLQESLFPSRCRVGELCDLYEAIYKAPGAADDLIETFGLAGLRRSRISALSGGMRQRLALALAQLGDVRLVILDELTTGLDPEQRRTTWQCVLELASRGVAVLLTSHNMDEVEALCHRVGVLQDGELIAFDTPARLTAAHGGPATFTVDLSAGGEYFGHRAADLVWRLDRLGTARTPAWTPARPQYSGHLIDAYSRIVQEAVLAGLPAWAVHHRAPTFEDAYLKLIGSSTQRASE